MSHSHQDSQTTRRVHSSRLLHRTRRLDDTALVDAAFYGQRDDRVSAHARRLHRRQAAGKERRRQRLEELQQLAVSGDRRANVTACRNFYPGLKPDRHVVADGASSAADTATMDNGPRLSPSFKSILIADVPRPRIRVNSTKSAAKHQVKLLRRRGRHGPAQRASEKRRQRRPRSGPRRRGRQTRAPSARANFLILCRSIRSEPLPTENEASMSRFSVCASACGRRGASGRQPGGGAPPRGAAPEPASLRRWPASLKTTVERQEGTRHCGATARVVLIVCYMCVQLFKPATRRRQTPCSAHSLACREGWTQYRPTCSGQWLWTVEDLAAAINRRHAEHRGDLPVSWAPCGGTLEAAARRISSCSSAAGAAAPRLSRDFRSAVAARSTRNRKVRSSRSGRSRNIH